MIRIDIVLCDFATQKVKIQAVFGPGVSLEAVVIHTSRRLRDEIDTVPADEVGDPTFANRACSNT
jgi:hypothetical protein